MDFIGRFENFNNDINHIFATLNIPAYTEMPHDRKSDYNGPCDCPYPNRGFFNTETAHLMYDHFKKDFDLFDYDPSDWETPFYLSQIRAFLGSRSPLGV